MQLTPSSSEFENDILGFRLYVTLGLICALNDCDLFDCGFTFRPCFHGNIVDIYNVK